MPPGRPREFDIDKALDRAMRVFWKKGYEGTSMPDLTKAMGINRPSLYAAFGNKESLFRKAIDRYTNGPACHVREALDEPTARQAVEKLLNGSIDVVTDSKNPRGCFLVQTALACGDECDAMRREMVKRRTSTETAIRERFERAVKEGDLPKNANPCNLAKFVSTLLFGMAVQAAGGASREELRKVVDIAMTQWPS